MNDVSNLLLQCAWKGALILAVGSAAALLPSKASAAFRHFCWTLTAALLLLLPAIIVTAPRWTLPLPAPAAAPPQTAAVTAMVVTPSHSTPRPKSNPLPWIYALGLLATAARFFSGAIRTGRLLGDSVPFRAPGLPRRVRVVLSPRTPVPLVWGIARPQIALPSSATRWPHARRRTVLLHELIHLRRHDLLAQFIAQAACCLYWYNPLAWIALREQRRQRERACDDAVLARGIHPAEYAGQLVDLARGISLPAPAMADTGDLESRVRALLDRAQNRAPVNRRIAAALTFAALLLLIPTASLTSYARPAPVPQNPAAGALTGTISDPSGARIPGAEIRLHNVDSQAAQTITSNPAGEFTFSDLPAGRYDLEFRVRGFKLGRKQVVVTAGQSTRADAFMEIGEVSETATVVGRRPAVAAPRSVPQPQRIPVGGNIQPCKLISQPRPIYPDDLQQQGITGTVIIRAIVSKEGQLLNPRVVNSDIHPGLAKAALDAVGRWLYEPSRLNGQPVEVLTTIQLSFQLDQ